MKLGMNFYSYGYSDKLSEEQIVGLLQENGFEAAFICNEAPNFDHAVDLLHKAGIAIDTIHAPFQNINSIWLPGEEGDEVLRRLTASFEAAAQHNIPVVVVHMSSGFHPPMISDIGNARYRWLMETADRLGVIPAIENIRVLANVALMFERYENARFCWDTGHEACYTPNCEFMPLFMDKLVALHIHDNDCIRDHDLHMLPYDGNMNFDTVARHIAKSGFRGTLMMELDGRSDFYSQTTPEEFYRRAAQSGRRLAAAIESYR